MTPRAYLDAVRKRCEAATAGECGAGYSQCGNVSAMHALASDAQRIERIARLAEDYREAVRKGNIESISADETRCALFAALEELK